MIKLALESEDFTVTDSHIDHYFTDIHYCINKHTLEHLYFEHLYLASQFFS